MKTFSLKRCKYTFIKYTTLSNCYNYVMIKTSILKQKKKKLLT